MNEVGNILVYPNQTTFIKGRMISDNTLMINEMLQGYDVGTCMRTTKMSY